MRQHDSVHGGRALGRAEKRSREQAEFPSPGYPKILSSRVPNLDNIRRGSGWRWGGLLLACALMASINAQTPLRGGTTVSYCVEKLAPIPSPTIFEVNHRLQPRQRIQVQAGEPGLKRSRWRVVQRNGRIIERQLLEEVVLNPPQPRIYQVGVYRHIASRGQVTRCLLYTSDAADE